MTTTARACDKTEPMPTFRTDISQMNARYNMSQTAKHPTPSWRMPNEYHAKYSIHTCHAYKSTTIGDSTTKLNSFISIEQCQK